MNNRLGTYLIGPKWRFKKKFFGYLSKKNLVPRMLSHRGNVRTSKFWRKSKEKKRNFFRKFTKGIWGFYLGQKKFKITVPHACVPFKWKFQMNLHYTQKITKRYLQCKVLRDEADEGGEGENHVFGISGLPLFTIHLETWML